MNIIIVKENGADWMLYNNEKYVIIFSSTYHGYYVENLLRRNEVIYTFKKAPRAIAPTCHTAIYIQEKDLDKVMKLISNVNVTVKGVYEVIKKGGLYDFKRIS